MLLAGSQLIPGALGATAEPGNPPAAPSFRPLCVEPVAGRWQWDGCHHVILARAASRVPAAQEVLPDGGRPCKVWLRGLAVPSHAAVLGGKFPILPASQKSGEVSSLALLSQLTRLSWISL